MALMEAYLVKTSNVADVFTAIQTAQAPDRFSVKFLENLGFTSSNDRLYIRVLKGLEMIDDAGVPNQRYFEFLDQSQSAAVMAEAVREAYSDLFQLRRDAWKMSEKDVENRLKTLTQGKKSDSVVHQMAKTFKVLADYADWDAPRPEPPHDAAADSDTDSTDQHDPGVPPFARDSKAQLHYNIQIHLPESRDPKVYEAIFEALNKHLI